MSSRDSKTIFNNFFMWPESDPLNIEDSYAWVINKNIPYIPSFSNKNIVYNSIKSLLSYLFIWLIVGSISYFLHPKFPALIIGFLTGLFILLIRIILLNQISMILPVRNPHPKLYIMNVPDIKQYNDKVKEKEEELIIPAFGDFKVLVKDDYFPKTDTDGYIISLKKYFELEKTNKIQGLDLTTFLDDSTCVHCEDYNFDKLNTDSYFSIRKLDLQTLLFYLGTIVLTYGIYVSDAELKIKILFFWILLVLITTFITYSFKNLPAYTNFKNIYNTIERKADYANLAISFAITTILIV